MGQHIRILAINGAGIRALMPATILHQISMKSGGKQVPELFDFIIGTSTAGILAAAYALPRTPSSTRRDQVQFTTRQVLNLLEDKLGYIFPTKQARSGRQLLFEAKYPRDNLDSLLEETYKVQGLDITLSQTLVPIVVTSMPVTGGWHYWYSCSERYSKYLLKDAVGATTTIPTYFPNKYIPVQNITQANAENCSDYGLIRQESTGKCQHALIYGGLYANSPLLLTTSLFDYVKFDMEQQAKQQCSRYPIFANDPANLTLQFRRSNSTIPLKVSLDQDIDITIVTLGTGHFVGNEIPTLDNMSGLRSLALASFAFSAISFVNFFLSMTNAIKAPPAEQCKFISQSLSSLVVGIGTLALSSYAYFNFIPKTERAKDGYVDLLRGGGALSKMIRMGEKIDIYHTWLFGGIVINPIFSNITKIPIDEIDSASLDMVKKTTLDYMERNPEAFSNLTKCLMNADKRIEECNYATLFFDDDFRDPIIPSINGTTGSKEEAVHHEHSEL